MCTDGTGFYTCKECHQTESLLNHITADHKEEEQWENRRNVGENSCNSGDGTDQRVQSLMFMMMMMKLFIRSLDNTVCSIFIWRWNWQSVPKRRHINFRRPGITPKKKRIQLIICVIFYSCKLKIPLTTIKVPH